MQDSPDVRFAEAGSAGRIHLDKPRSLNALTEEMCRAIRGRLLEWQADDAVRAVVVTAEGERAFCAGGDVRRVCEIGRADPVGARSFFAAEYRMDALIAEFPKPYVCVMDGIVMGGGLGISVNGCYRVAGERTVAAMPETGIGLLPDVGATAFLDAAPGRTGLYLGLTGARMDVADTLHAGFTTHFVPAARHGELVDALAGLGATDDDFAAVEGVLGAFAEDPGPSKLAGRRGDIDRLFAADTVEEIFAALAADDSEFAADTLATMRRMSPTSMKITARQLTGHPGLSVREALALEYRMICHVLDRHDFYEGIRAVLIDKDGSPRWSPDTLEGVAREEVDAHFVPLGDAELALG